MTEVLNGVVFTMTFLPLARLGLILREPPEAPALVEAGKQNPRGWVCPLGRAYSTIDDTRQLVAR